MEICCGTTTAIHDSPPLSMSVQNTSHLCRASSRWIVLLIFLLLAVPALVRAQDAVPSSVDGSMTKIEVSCQATLFQKAWYAARGTPLVFAYAGQLTTCGV